jgi:hypothetical protein
MIGKTLGHYQVIEKPGEGGLGAAHKARDTQLDLFVAASGQRLGACHFKAGKSPRLCSRKVRRQYLASSFV